MRRTLGCAILGLLLATMACRKAPTPSAVPGTPTPGAPTPTPPTPVATPTPSPPVVKPRPEAPPKLSSAAALRPSFAVGKKKSEAGTAFIVKDAAGQKYLLTAAHLFDTKGQWSKVEGVTLRTLEDKAQKTAGKSVGPPSYVGVPFDRLPLMPNGLPGMMGELDLVVYPLTKESTGPALKLAAADPATGDWVWILGKELDKPTRGAYLARVSTVADGCLVLQAYRPFNMNAFSGGPIVSEQGEVIGNLLGADTQGRIFAGAVSGIRRQMKKLNVAIE